jgi:hypothetical protein
MDGGNGKQGIPLRIVLILVRVRENAIPVLLALFARTIQPAGFAEVSNRVESMTRKPKNGAPPEGASGSDPSGKNGDRP